jgi:hypothetical protein
MYATIRIYDQAEGLADAVAENRDEILGIFRGIDGFHSYYIVKTGPTSATSITVCADQAPRPRTRPRATTSPPSSRTCRSARPTCTWARSP